MAERRPLVLIAGEVQELPSGDTLPGAGSGGSAAPGFSFTQSHNGSPTIGQFNVLTSPDSFVIHKQDADGTDWSGLLDQIEKGWLVEIFDPADPNGAYSILKVDAASLGGDLYTLQGAFIESLGNIATGSPMTVTFDAATPSGLTLDAIGDTAATGAVNVAHLFTITIASSDAIVFDPTGFDPILSIKPTFLTLGDGASASGGVTIASSSVVIAGSSFGGLISICPSGETLKLFGGSGSSQWSAIADAADASEAVTKLNQLLANLRTRGDLAT